MFRSCEKVRGESDSSIQYKKIRLAVGVVGEVQDYFLVPPSLPVLT